MEAMKPRVLVVDDEPSLCSLLEVFFQRRGFAVDSASDRKETAVFLNKPEPVMALVDLSLGKDSGLSVQQDLNARFPALPVVVMTAYGTVEKAVEAIKQGAFDFITKPFDMEFLGKVVDKALSTRALREENKELRRLIQVPTLDFIGRSEAMRALQSRMEAASASDSTALITGESGTGKELVARLIHQKSLRSAKPFVVVNCSALSENLLESELFGHVKGAFTSAHADKEGLFSVAEGGSAFLDEIGDMPLRTQVKLLRVLQEREVTPVWGTATRKIDVRILAATNVDLEQAVVQGKFREDLYYRLNVLRLHMPKLSEREDDAVLLANHFLEKKTKGRRRFSPAALAEISEYSWPGNVRQLENAVERAIAFAPGEIIEGLDVDGSRKIPDKTAAEAAEPGAAFPPSLTEVEKAYIHWMLTQNQWQKPKVAKILGLDISTLYRKIEKYGLKQVSESASDSRNPKI